jgi:hypothetical protein
MPAFYRIENSESVASPGIGASLAGAFASDAKQGGALTPGEYQALLIGEEIKPLPHPTEWFAVRAHNQTFLSTSLKGIFLRVERHICLGCGRVFDAPRIVFSGAAGCLPALLGALAVFILLHFVFVLLTIDAAFAAWMTLMLVPLFFQLAGALYLRMRFSQRQKRLAQPVCPACGNPAWAPVSRMAGKRIKLGREGKWVQVSIAGIS